MVVTMMRSAASFASSATSNQISHDTIRGIYFPGSSAPQIVSQRSAVRVECCSAAPGRIRAGSKEQILNSNNLSLIVAALVLLVVGFSIYTYHEDTKSACVKLKRCEHNVGNSKGRSAVDLPMEDGRRF
jgi:hypothetical protein